MHVDDIVSHLEMTSQEQLIPAAPVPEEIVLREVSDAELDVIKDVHDRLARPFYWRSLAWGREQWLACLNKEGIRTWLADVGGEPMGLVQLHIHPGGDVEFDFFGVVPEFVGKGYGGHLLTIATRLAWSICPDDVDTVRRVWLKTSCYDHPSAKKNYESRGYRHFHTETIPRDLVMPQT
ncbi:MAG: GNAT family N-acetyltransferase [Kutzneria sp.]|nr:GNAT family N-acetyltransferase [Kutzneria sp.]